jgi:hypothetical protein
LIRTRDILRQIRILGSVHFITGTGTVRISDANKKSELRIWSRIMFLGLPDPDSLVRDTGTDPDPSITKQK